MQHDDESARRVKKLGGKLQRVPHEPFANLSLFHGRRIKKEFLLHEDDYQAGEQDNLLENIQ